MAASRTVRMLGILLLLRAKEWISAKELAERFHVALRTVYRDIAAIQDYGIPVQGVPGPEGGYHLETEGAIDPRLFASDEALSLFLLGSGGPNPPDGFQRRVKALLDELEGEIRPEDVRLLRLARTRIHFDTSDWYWREEGSALVPILREAIFNEQILHITYRHRGSNEPESFQLSPFGLVWKGGQWYVVGRRNNDKIERYRVGRIDDLTRTESFFTFPEDFKLERWWAQEMNSFGAGNIRVHLMALPAARSEFLSLAIKDTSEVEQRGDKTYITLYVDKWKWLVPLLLSYTGSVYVEEPEELREEIISEMKTALRAYEEGLYQDTASFVNDDSRKRATYGRGPVDIK